MSGSDEIKSYEDFKGFIMICAASSDFHVTEEEHQFIVKNIPEERYLKLKRIAERCSDFECVNLISDHKDEYLKSPEDKMELINEILMLFNSDNNFNSLERNMLLALKRIL